MHPTLFTVGRVAVSSYTVLLDLGLILGLALAYVEGRRRLGSGDQVLDAGLWAVLGGIVGGRIGFVLANLDVFAEDPLRAVRVWEGGLAFHGAFLGGLLALGVVGALQGRGRERGAAGMLDLADAVTPGLALGMAFGWAACLLAGCAYGVAGEGPGFYVLPDSYGVEAPRFATQAAGLAYSLLLFGAAWVLRRDWPFAGAGFLLFGLFYFAGQFFLEYTRGDETIMLGRWRLGQALDLALVLLFAAGVLALWWRARRRSPEQKPLQHEGHEGHQGGDE